jgi:RNA polymerase sigma-70 factor (ECF subfamily)
MDEHDTRRPGGDELGQGLGPVDARMSEIWREHHRYLLDVAYRMLGSLNEAEDVVQEAFARLLDVDLDDLDDVRGWLVVVVSRRCLDLLRSARVRREAYVGPWLPEPLIEPVDDGLDPAERVTLDDSVRMALLVVLERLTPAERVAFVLHDVFRFSFDDVAAIVGRSPAACRQLASRARRHVEDETGPSRFQVDPAVLRTVADRFIAAASSGNLEALMQVLDADVVGWTDTGGLRGAPRRAVSGRVRVGSTFLAFLKAFGVQLAPMPVNGEPGVLAMQGHDLLAVLTFEVRDERITRIHSIANPDKLAYVRSLLA